MAEPFQGSITMFGGNFNPRNYAFCNGAILATSQNESLFSLLGTLYGGDGRTTFGLPDLRGRLPIHRNDSSPGIPVIPQGARSGVERVTLRNDQLPNHTHRLQASASDPTTTTAAGAILGAAEIFTSDTTEPLSALYSQSVQSTGGSQPHDNLMPYCAVNFIIALQGIYPTRS